MYKLIGASAILIGCAGSLNCWRSSCRMRIDQMRQLCALYGSAQNIMKNSRVSMIVFFRGVLKAAQNRKEDAVAIFANALVHALEERRYATGEEAWEASMECADWSLKKDELELVRLSASAFFGRDLSENLKKLAFFEARMEELQKSASVEFSEKNRVWTPAGMMLGILLVVVFI